MKKKFFLLPIFILLAVLISCNTEAVWTFKNNSYYTVSISGINGYPSSLTLAIARSDIATIYGDELVYTCETTTVTPVIDYEKRIVSFYPIEN